MGMKEDLDVAARIAHVNVLTSIEDKVAPKHTALVVIDMQNDFCAHGGLVSKDGRDLTEAQAMAKRLPALLSSARAAGVMVVFVRCVYSSDRNTYLSDVWLEQAARERKGAFTRIPVCAADSWEGDWFEDVRPEPTDIIVNKHRYDAFQGTDLDLILRTHGIRTLVMTGVVTNVCVETTARSGFVKDYYIAAVDDGCAAYVREDHVQTMRNITRFFGVVTNIKELTAIWGNSAQARVAAE
jgi:ureidoacrylate peracid hydrolase